MNLAQHIVLFMIRLYRWFVSPALTLLFGAACRFEPTCSVYAMGAVREHGALGGGWLAAKRLARCQPWGGCGFDPVPETASCKPYPASSSSEPSGQLRASHPTPAVH